MSEFFPSHPESDQERVDRICFEALEAEGFIDEMEAYKTMWTQVELLTRVQQGQDEERDTAGITQALYTISAIKGHEVISTRLFLDHLPDPDTPTKLPALLLLVNGQDLRRQKGVAWSVYLFDISPLGKALNPNAKLGLNDQQNQFLLDQVCELQSLRNDAMAPSLSPSLDTIMLDVELR